MKNPPTLDTSLITAIENKIAEKEREIKALHHHYLRICALRVEASTLRESLAVLRGVATISSPFRRSEMTTAMLSILNASDTPLHTKEVVKILASRGFDTTPASLASTLYRYALLKEIRFMGRATFQRLPVEKKEKTP